MWLSKNADAGGGGRNIKGCQRGLCRRNDKGGGGGGVSRGFRGPGAMRGLYELESLTDQICIDKQGVCVYAVCKSDQRKEKVGGWSANLQNPTQVGCIEKRLTTVRVAMERAPGAFEENARKRVISKESLVLNPVSTRTAGCKWECPALMQKERNSREE